MKYKVVCAMLAAMVALQGVPLPAMAEDAANATSNEIETFSSEDESESIVTVQPGQGETVVADDAELLDNDELFAGYVEQRMYSSLNEGIALFVSEAGESLTGLDKTIYGLLKSRIKQVADGELTSTQFLLNWEQLGLKTTYTKDELGVSAIIKDGKISEEAANVMWAKLEFDLNAIYSSLLADCPYEQYWHDKTKGISFGSSRLSATTNTISFADDGLTFAFAVASSYAGSAEFTVNTAKTGAATAAMTNAQNIVSANQGKSDYEKLWAYCQAICNNVTYNNGTSGMAYGDPWQLIYVFDNDASTNVVCEGYSKAFKYLCDISTFNSDITCSVVTGTMDGGTGAGAHMWNIVTMEDGQNYLVDVTNCDEGSIGSPDKLFMVGSPAGTAEGYQFSVSGSVISYLYDESTKSIFESGDLLLSKNKKYVLPATLSGTEGNNGWYKTITLTAPTGYQISASKNGTYTNTLTNISDGNYSSSGYTYYLKSTTDATEVVEKSVKFKKDGTKPTISSATASNVTQNAAKITVTAADTLSGLDSKGYSVELPSGVSAGQVTNNNDGTFNISGLTAGTTYNFKVKAKDKAGNESTAYSVSVTTAAKTSITGGQLTVTGSATYDGREHRPTVKLTLGGQEIENTNYIITYSRDGKTTTDLTSAGTITVTVTANQNGDFEGSVSGSYKIEKVSLTPVLNVNGVTKVYDGTTDVTGANKPVLTLSGAVNGETPVLAGGTVYAYEDKNVGVGKKITASNIALSDAAVNKNYVLSKTVVAATGAAITKATPNVSAAASAIQYGQKLSVSNLTGSSGGPEGTWSWENADIRPETTGVQRAVFTPMDSANYLSVTKNISVTVNVTKPQITLNVEAETAKPGQTVTVDSVSAKNPYDPTLECPDVQLSWRINDGQENVINGNSFTVPDTARVNDVITVTASTAGVAGKYTVASVTDQLTVTAKENAAAKISFVAIGSITYGDAVTCGKNGSTIYATFDAADAGENMTYKFSADNGNTWKSLADLQKGATIPAGSYMVKAIYEDENYYGEKTTNFTVAKKTLTASVNGEAATKTYDGTTAVPVGFASNHSISLAGVLAGDVVTATADYAYNNKNVSAATKITASNIALTGADKSNYKLAATTAELTGCTITQRTVQPVVTFIDGGQRKAYDGTLNVDAGRYTLTAAGGVTGETILLSGTAKYTDVNAGKNKTIEIKNITITNDTAGNYKLSNTTLQDNTGEITALGLTPVLDVRGVTKVYDGTTAISGEQPKLSFTGAITGETPVAGSVTYAYTDANAGANKEISATGIRLSDASVNRNYYLIQSEIIVSGAEITKATPVVSMTASDIYYGQKLADSQLAAGEGELAGLWSWKNEAIQPEETAAQTAVFTPTDTVNYKTVEKETSVQVKATKPVITLTPDYASQIYGKKVKVTLAIQNPYDAELEAPSAAEFTYTINGVTNNLGADGTFTIPANTPVGTIIVVTAKTNAVSGKYLENTVTTNVTVSDKSAVAITITVPALSYGETPAPTGTVGGVVNDSLTYSYSNDGGATWKTLQALGDKNGVLPAGEYKVKTVYEDSTRKGSAEAAFTVQKKMLTLSVTGSTVKTYDATLNVPAGHKLGIALEGIINTDHVTCTATSYVYEDKNVGTGKTVIASGLQLDGADAANYAIPVNAAPKANVGTINQANATIAPKKGQKKVYGEKDMTLEYTVDGLMGGDTLHGALGRESGESVGEYSYTIGTLANDNYALTLHTEDKFIIEKCQVSDIGSSTTVSDKVYDGNIDADASKITITLPCGEVLVEGEDFIVISKSYASSQAGKTTMDVSFYFLETAKTANYALTYGETAVQNMTVDAVIQQAEYPQDKQTEVVWPTAGEITEGQSLSDSKLIGGNGEGTFTWADPDTKPKAGTHTYTVIFTPDDTNYKSVTKEITVTVKAKASSATVDKDDKVAPGTADTSGIILWGSTALASVMTVLKTKFRKKKDED